ncbi:acid-sensing ion channel 3-like [Littorina saxatilis]|uniref:acid-sensing ion channel 3-like n=1 Tax=Littorina saxatilis TaxID=31220 RepID=UPI0038B54A60
MEAKAKEEFQNFISSTTAHGISRIFDKKHALLRRCLWAVFVVTAVTMLVLMMHSSYLDINSLPFKTVSSVKMTSPLPFPALTICNINPLDATKLAGSTFGSDIDGNLTVESTTVDGLIPDQTSVPLINTATEKASPLNESAGKQFKSARIEVGEFFTSCRYGGNDESDNVDCSTIFSPILLTFDSCFVLNASKLQPATRRTSLRLTINVNAAGYFPNVLTLGVKYHVHTPGDLPEMYSSSRHVASPGYATHVGLKVVEYHYLASPYKAFGDSECVETDTAEFRQTMDGSPELYPGSKGSPYSLDACVLMRAYEIVNDICNCSQIFTPSDVLKPCSLADIACLSYEQGRIMNTALATGELLQCPRPCHTVSYVPTISSIYYPAPASVQLLQGQTGLNLSEYRKNYLQLNIYYEDMMTQETRQEPEYDWITIMGLLGGNMGFFLGASVLTLAEVLDFVVCLLTWAARGVWRRYKGRSFPTISVRDSGHRDTDTVVMAPEEMKVQEAWR